MKTSLQSSLTKEQKRIIARSRARRRMENGWLLSILGHGFVLAVIAIFSSAEWSQSPQSSFAWKVRLVQAKSVQLPEHTPPPEQQQVLKSIVEAAPPPQPLAQVKRGTEHRLRELQARMAKQGPVQTRSVRPNMIRASSSQSPPLRQTTQLTPRTSQHEESDVTADLLASVPNRSLPRFSQLRPAYLDKPHSNSHTTSGKAMWQEGVQHTLHKKHDFSVNGREMIASAAERQILDEAPRHAAQLQEEDFGWLTTALNKKVQGLKRYPYQAKLRSMEGKVVLRATVKKNGVLSTLTVESPSGHRLLDQDALETVKKAFPLTLKHNINRSYIVLLLPITYALKTL